MNKDSKGNIYTELKNIRLTYVKSSNRSPDKDWPEMDVIRIQSYRNLNSKSLHKGAEIPIESKEDVIDIISKLLEIHEEIYCRKDKKKFQQKEFLSSVNNNKFSLPENYQFNRDTANER